MKVMVVCTTGGSGRRQLGGAERLLIDLLPAVARTGVDIVACTPDDAVGEACKAAGLHWIELAARRRTDPDYVRSIRRVVRQERPDVVDAHLLSAAMHCRAALAVGYRHIPLIVTMHSSLWQHRAAAPSTKDKAAVQLNIVLDLAMRRIRPHVSVAVSEYEAAELRGHAGAADVRVIANSLPATWPGPRPNRAVPDRPVVGFLGRLERDKGADLLGDIAAALPEADFRIAGAGTVAVPELRNIRLLGHVAAAEFLSGIDCLVVPSRVESFGLSALEALSLGVPVVHSGAGGLAEVTRTADGVLAYRSELSPAAIAAGVRKATAAGWSADERRSTAQWYQDRFAFPRIVDSWASLYRSVSDGSRQR
jgi:glycosyltransferase involved in cell wall biosynthesis